MPIISLSSIVPYIISPHEPGLARASNSQKWKLEELRKEHRLTYAQLIQICRKVTGLPEFIDIGQLTPSEAVKVRQILERKEY